MKKILTSVLSAFMVFVLSACGNAAVSSTTAQSAAASTAQPATVSSAQAESKAHPGKKTLIVYFSWSGNTESVANEIKTQTGADIFKITPKAPYTKDYNTLLDVAQKELKDKARPAFSGAIQNFSSYDTVFVGYPIWWGDMPMILYTFFDTYDFSGKTIVPFVTSGGSGFANTVAEMKQLEPKAAFRDGLALSSTAAKSPKKDVARWLSNLK